MKKVLIIGDSSVIGANFIEAYKNKYEIYVPDPEEEDLTRYENAVSVFGGESYDAVVYAVCGYDSLTVPASGADGEVVPFKNLQRAAVSCGVKKLLVVGNAADLDLGKPIVNATEELFGESVPKSSYGKGRYLVTRLASMDNISTVFRIFGLYGKYDSADTNRELEILSHALSGKKEIKVPADKTFSAIYAEDACKIIAAFIDNDYPRGTYNLASPAPVTLSEFAKKAKSYAKKDAREVTVEIGDGEENELTADVSKLLSTLGSFKFTAHSTGIAKTLDYYKAHKSKLRKGGNK